MIEKDNPIIRVVLDSGKIVWMKLQDAIDAGLIEATEKPIEDKRRDPQGHKMRKRDRR